MSIDTLFLQSYDHNIYVKSFPTRRSSDLRKKRDEIEAGKSYCSRRFGGATCDDKSAQIYARFDKTLQVGYANHFYRSAHKFEQICRHRLRRQNVGYSN